MLRQYREIVTRIDQVESEMRKTVYERDQLIGLFNRLLGGLRLTMRLRRRSGGLLTWRNIAKCSNDQRDFNLEKYQDDLIRLPQSIRQDLMKFEKKRILVNLNLSLLQHESKQLKQAIKKIDLNTTILESMAS